MDFILEYAEYGGVSLPKGITITSYERMAINRIIKQGLEEFYSVDRSSEDFVVNGKVIHPEYIFKAINNLTLLKKIVLDPDRKIVSDINSKEDLFEFIKSNLYNLLHYDGIYFDVVYNLLVNTSKKGKRLEEMAFKEFEEMGRKKGMNVKIEPPSLQEDLSGIDGIFIINGKRFTIQVKPLVSIVEDDVETSNAYFVKCDGALKNLITDYLITINDNEVWIFRSRGITAHAAHYVIPKSNLVQ